MIIDTTKDKFLLVTFSDNQFSAISIEGMAEGDIVRIMDRIKLSKYIKNGRSIYPASSLLKFSFSSSKGGTPFVYEDVSELIINEQSN